MTTSSNVPDGELDGLIARYDDWHECDEYHIHDGTDEHEGQTPLPHDFDDVRFKTALKALFATAQQQMLRELMGHQELLQYLGSDPRTGHIEAVPLSVLQHKLDEIGKEQGK